MNWQSGDFEEPKNIRLLRRLVTALLVFMIAGFSAIVIVLIMKVSALEPTPSLADSIVLPEGHVATAVTFGNDWIAVVTDNSKILIFDRTGTELLQSVVLNN